MATECISIIDPDNGSGTDYTSLSAWEADLGAGGTPAVTSSNLVSNNEQAIARCRSTSGADDTAQFYPYGWTTGAGNEIIVEGTDFPTDGVWDATKYVLKYAGDTIIQIREEYVQIKNIQILMDYAGAQDGLANITGTGDGLLVDSVFVKRTDSDTGVHSGIRSANGGVWTIKNSIVVGNTNGTGYGVYIANGTADIFNCTIYGADYGLRDGGSKITAKNCAVGNNGDDFLGTFASIDYCCSDDGDGTNSQNPVSSDWANEFTDAANDDFSLVSGGNCIDNGTDLSGSGVTEDIIGTSRSGSYDIGAFEFAAAGDLTISINENMAVTENIAQQFDSLVLNVSDNLAVSEFLDLSMPLGSISVVDGIGAAENIGPDVPLAAITGIDNLTVQEVLSLLKDLVPSVFENIGVNEFISILSQLGGINVADNVGLVENIDTIMQALNTQISDNIVASEFITTALEIILSKSESIGLAETIAVLLDLLKSAVENIGIAENISVALPGLLGDITAQDIVAVIENIQAAMELGDISKADLIGLSENISAAMELAGVDATEIIAVIENISAAMELAGVDGIDAIGIIENIAVEIEGVLGSISQVQLLAVVENIQAAMALAPISAADNLGVLENIQAAVSIARSIFDNVGISENIAAALEIIFATSESIVLTESINVVLTGLLGAISNQETIALSESISIQLPGLQLSNADAIGLLETILAVIPLSLTISDLVGISEYILINLEAGVNLTESLVLIEDIQVQFDNLLFQRVENIKVAEFIQIVVSGIVGKITAAIHLTRPGAQFALTRPGAQFALTRPGSKFTLE